MKVEIKDAKPGECWAARDEDGEVCLFREKPELNGDVWDCTFETGVKIGYISFRPDLPWNETACKVRVRLEVVNEWL